MSAEILISFNRTVTTNEKFRSRFPCLIKLTKDIDRYIEISILNQAGLAISNGFKDFFMLALTTLRIPIYSGECAFFSRVIVVLWN